MIFLKIVTQEHLEKKVHIHTYVRTYTHIYIYIHCRYIHTHTYTILPKVLGHPLLMKCLTTLVILDYSLDPFLF